MSTDKIRVEEVSKIISDRIQNYGQPTELQETGTVLAVGDGIARVYGLEGAMAGELVEFANKTKGVIPQPRRRQRWGGNLWRNQRYPRRRHRPANDNNKLIRYQSAKLCSDELWMHWVRQSMVKVR